MLSVIKSLIVLILVENSLSVSVRVTPCATNKVNRRSAQDNRSPRTFGYIGNFLSQETELEVSDFGQSYNDCLGIQEQFEIESDPSKSQPNQQKFFGNWFTQVFWRPPNPSPQPSRPPPQPPTTTTRKPPGQYYPPPFTPAPERPKPTRPPQGGYFGSNNYYKPPNHVNPSHHVKPVHENAQEIYNQQHYRPTVVGGAVNQIVGYNPVRPRPEPGSIFFPDPSGPYRTRDGIFGSYVDLLFW